MLLALTASAAAPSPVAERVARLTRKTEWTQVDAIPLRFRTFHPQGMVRVGENWFVSSVEIVERPAGAGNRRTAGKGVGHLFKVAPDGRLLADLIVGEGDAYHPGGIDFDGTSIWLPVAEYRPDSRAILYRVDPATMSATEVLRWRDHVGALVHDVAGQALVGVSWGARRFVRWPLRGGRVGADATVTVNPAQYIDYQDCHAAGAGRMLCAGVAEYRATPDDPAFMLGGLELVDLKRLRPIRQVPLTLRSATGRAMTQNPFWAEATATGLRAWFLPDDDASILYAFDAAVK